MGEPYGFDIEDQTDRIVVITGANSGIGLETTKVLTAAGATVVMACRSVARAEAARMALVGAQRKRAIVSELDLASPASVEAFATKFGSEYGRLDLLINNAGIMAPPPALTKEGIERQWATNHLGHFALTGLLLDYFQSRPGARVISVSSLAAAGGSSELTIRTDLDEYSRFGTYEDTKLANLVFAVELNHRLAAENSTAISVACHPGITHTNLAAGIAIPGFTKLALKASQLMFQPVAIGALPILRAATERAVEGGQYYGPSGPRQRRGLPKQIPLVAGAANRSTGRSLWEQSMDLSGVRYLSGD